ncbi:MAG: hypothetical protein JSS43_28985 [Proteobacteria bacterium]|nr:hypothetical protein [Pseudomonadota bacterium]
MIQPAETTAREPVYLSLIPFFLEAAGGNRADARAAAEAAIAGLNPATMDEFFLAAQIVVYNLASFDSLRWSKEAPDLAPSAALRLRGNANAMHRAAMQCRKALDQRRKAAAAPANPPATHVPPPSAERTYTEADVREAVRCAAAVLSEARAAAQSQPPMNRAARRAAKIQAQRAQRAAAHAAAA